VGDPCEYDREDGIQADLNSCPEEVTDF